MFAKALHGTSLITIQPAHPKFSGISQILLDLQSIVGSPSLSLHLRTDSLKVLTFAALTPTYPRIYRRNCIDGRVGSPSTVDRDSRPLVWITVLASRLHDFLAVCLRDRRMMFAVGIVLV